MNTEKLYVKSKKPVTVVTAPFVSMNVIDVIRTMLTGAGVGLVSTGLYLLLNTFVFGAALCRAGVEGCSNAPLYATIVTVVTAIILGVVALAKAGTYRPLLVAIAAPLALWGIYALFNSVAWYWALVIGAVLLALAYALFAWLARLRSFIISIILLVLVALLVRFIVG